MDKNYTRKDINSTSIELTVTVPKDAFEKSYNTLLEKEAKGIDLKGFRKGAVPKEVIESKLKSTVMLETFERLAPLYISQAITFENLEIVAPPIYKEIPKLELGQEIVFTVTVTVMPEFKLGNMKKVKVEKKKVEITKEEMDRVLSDIESKETKAKKGSKAWAQEISTLLGIDKVESKEALVKEIEKILLEQKELNVRKEQENDALNQAIKLCKIEIPEPAVDYEAYEREASFMENLAQRKLTLDQFTKANNITLESMRELWKKDAKEALETDVFLKLYAKTKDLTITDEELNLETDKIKKEHAGHGHDHEYNAEWSEYIRRVMIKQKAYDKFISEVLPIKK